MHVDNSFTFSPVNEPAADQSTYTNTTFHQPQSQQPHPGFDLLKTSTRPPADYPSPPEVAEMENDEMRIAFMTGVENAPEMDFEDVAEETGEVPPGNVWDAGMLQEIHVRKRPGQSLGAELEGVQVMAVLKRSPAHTAGLKPGDRITSINSTPVESYADIVAALSATKSQGASFRAHSQASTSGAVGYTFIVEPHKKRRRVLRKKKPAPTTKAQRDQAARRRRRHEAKRKKRREEKAQTYGADAEYMVSTSESSESSSEDPEAKDLLQRQYAPPPRLRRKTSPGWANTLVSCARAIMTLLVGILCFILWATNDQRDSCQYDMRGLMLANFIVLVMMSFLTFLTSSMCLKGVCPAASRGSHGVCTPARASLTVSSLLFFWCFGFVIVEMHHITRENALALCGDIFGAVEAQLIVQIAFIGTIFLCFCSMYTHPGDDEDASRCYGSYSPPRGLDRKVGKVANV